MSIIGHPLGSYGSDCVQTCQYLNNSIYDLLNGMNFLIFTFIHNYYIKLVFNNIIS